MSLLVLRFLSLCSCIASVAGQVNLLTYVNGGIGDILGSFFGASGTIANYDYVVVGGGTDRFDVSHQTR